PGAGHVGVAVGRRRFLHVRRAAGRRRPAVDARVPGAVDRALRHLGAPGHGWFVIAAGGADQPARADGGGLLVEGNRPLRRVLPPEPAVEPRRRGRGVPRARPVPVLLLLGNDAGADVLPDRDLGPQRPGRPGTHLRRDQVLHL